MLAHFAQRHSFAGQGNKELQVAQGQLPPLLDGGAVRLSAGQQLPGLAKNPGVAEGASGHHHRVAARFRQHGDHVAGGEEVAAADDRNGYRPFQFGNLGPVGVAVEHLGPAPRVERDGVASLVGGNPGNVQKVAVVAAPAAPDLDRQRQAGRLAGRPDDGPDLGRLPEQGAAGAAADHLFHRASHVDIDQIAVRLHHPGRFGDQRRIVAEQLDTERAVLRRALQQLERFFPLADQAVDADHLGKAEGRSLLAGEQAERQVGDTGHGGEQQIVGQRQRADGKACYHYATVYRTGILLKI